MFLHYFKPARMQSLIAAALLTLFIQSESPAAFGEDTEKPVPEFTRAGETITAKFIPRAKSTSILIDFKAAQGRLTDVKGIEYESLKTPEVDIKEFKSSFFDVTVDDIPPGSQAVITISSAFFTVSTEYWLYSAKRPVKWFDSGITAKKGAGNADQFVIQVADGGELDGDGMPNGRIHLIGGPKDYFWSYAIGTLVVRFFGVFLVLSILMIGMLAAGRIFISLEKKRIRIAAPSSPNARPAPRPQAEPIISLDAASAPDLETVAAIAAALHLHLAPDKTRETVDTTGTDQNSWVQQGRADMQNARLQTFLRPVNPKNHF